METNKNKIRVDKETFDTWKLNRFHGDISRLCKETGLSRAEISIAVNYGACTFQLQTAISEYFSRNSPY